MNIAYALNLEEVIVFICIVRGPLKHFLAIKIFLKF